MKLRHRPCSLEENFLKGSHSLPPGRPSRSFRLCCCLIHYCRKRMLSRLKTAFSPGFSTGTTLPGQKVPIFYPGWFNRDKSNFISRLKFSTGNKGGEKTKKKAHFCSSHRTSPPPPRPPPPPLPVPRPSQRCAITSRINFRLI